jgi:DnaJ-class molecular chaperone
MAARPDGTTTRSIPSPPEPSSRIVACSFCRGTGKDPFGIMSTLSSCCACGGKGSIRLDGPHRGCPHCRGSGAVKTFTCGACRGSGFVPEAEEPNVACPDCQGTGDASGDPALGCLRCRGRGRVAALAAH